MDLLAPVTLAERCYGVVYGHSMLPAAKRRFILASADAETVSRSSVEEKWRPGSESNPDSRYVVSKQYLTTPNPKRDLKRGYLG
jgi:hypothetical protein